MNIKALMQTIGVFLVIAAFLALPWWAGWVVAWTAMGLLYVGAFVFAFISLYKSFAGK